MKTKNRFTKIAVASGLVVASGAAVLGITGFASAELAQKNSIQAVAQADDSNSTPGLQAPTGRVDAQAFAGDHMDGAAPFATDGLAKVLGLTTTELNTQLQSGKSLADIAKAQNVDIADVKAQLLKDFSDKENAEVKTGEHTQAEVDAKIASFKANLDTMVNNAGGMRGPGMGGGHMGGAAPFATDGLAKVLGLTTTELNTQLQSGKSLADIAKAQNVDIADVKAQLLKDFSDKENAEVKTGEHTQAEVDAKIADFKTRLDDMVNGVRPAGGPGMGGIGGRMGVTPIASEAVAKALGLSSTELQTQLQSGKSLADIAKAQNVDVAKVKAAITADIKAHLDDEVKSGEHTQAEADQKLAEITANLDDMVNGVRPAGGPGMGGKGMRGGHGPHGDGGPMGGMMGGQNGTPSGSNTQGASFSA